MATTTATTRGNEDEILKRDFGDKYGLCRSILDKEVTRLAEEIGRHGSGVRDLYNGAVRITPLQHALMAQWREGVDRLLDAGATVDVWGGGYDPYALACRSEDEDTRLQLLKSLTDHAQTIRASTYCEMVNVTRSQQHHRVLGLLEENKGLCLPEEGIDVDTLTDPVKREEQLKEILRNKYPLYKSIAEQDLDALREQMTRGIDVVDLYDCGLFDVTPLQHALRRRWYEGAELLLGAGADTRAGMGDVEPYLLACNGDEDYVLRFVRLFARYSQTMSVETFEEMMSSARERRFLRLVELMERDRDTLVETTSREPDSEPESEFDPADIEECSPEEN